MNIPLVLISRVVPCPRRETPPSTHSKSTSARTPYRVCSLRSNQPSSCQVVVRGPLLLAWLIRHDQIHFRGARGGYSCRPLRTRSGPSRSQGTQSMEQTDSAASERTGQNYLCALRNGRSTRAIFLESPAYSLRASTGFAEIQIRVLFWRSEDVGFPQFARYSLTYVFFRVISYAQVMVHYS